MSKLIKQLAASNRKPGRNLSIIPETEAVEVRGKIRTVIKGTKTPAMNTKTGKPIDGGGWDLNSKNAQKALRQQRHLADARDRAQKHHGKM